MLIKQAGFAAVDAVTGLKLIEGGLHKETIAFVALAAVPIQVILPAVLRLTFVVYDVIVVLECFVCMPTYSSQ